MDDAKLSELAERFCVARLPETVCADLCATDRDYKYPRYGTNLLTVDEAKDVMRQVMEGFDA